MEHLSGKVAVVTGGASGIGLATAQALGERGVRLVIADIEAEALAVATRALGDAGVEIHPVVTDVSSREAVERLADEAWARFGGVDIVFNNAGIIAVGALDQLTPQDWRWSLDVNLWGAIHGADVFAPRLIAQGRPAHMLFTASFAGLVANRGMIAYCVSKAGVVSLAECLQKELSEHEIGVSVLCPMRVQSSIDQSFRNRPAALGGPDRTATFSEEQILGMTGRTLSADDVAELVVGAIQRDQLYIHTHAEGREFVRRKWARADGAFEHAL